MPQEPEPSRPPEKAPRGCRVAFLVGVGLLALFLVVVAIALQPRFTGADPF